MPLPYVTVQVDSLDANAGNALTENVSVQSPSSLLFSGGTGSSPADTGIAATTNTTSTPWAIYFLIAALLYFAGKELS